MRYVDRDVDGLVHRVRFFGLNDEEKVAHGLEVVEKTKFLAGLYRRRKSKREINDSTGVTELLTKRDDRYEYNLLQKLTTNMTTACYEN